MAFSRDHLYLTVHGIQTNLGVPEPWQFGLRMMPTTSGQPGPFSQGFANECRTAMGTLWANINTAYQSFTEFQSVKLARIGADGKYVGDEGPFTAELPSGDRPGGQFAVAPLPAQCAVAVTLTTGVLRGLANKGRVYLPAPHAGRTSQGGLDVATQTLLAEQFRNFLQSLNTLGVGVGGGGARTAVMSDTRSGASRWITGVEVGRRIDIQRRRAETIPEQYLPRPVAVPPAGN